MLNVNQTPHTHQQQQQPQPSPNTQTRTLWIGDIENWMDEKFLTKVFSDLSKLIFNPQRLSKA